jgi:uncharacterized protein (TIGR02594 family)
MRTLLVLLALCLASPAFAKGHHHAAPAPEHHWWQSAPDLVSEARSQIGNGPIYGRRSLWCARFVNAMLAKTGHRGTGSDLAKSFLSDPRTTMHVGAIAVLARRGGGHVAIVSGVTAGGDPVLISGNNMGRVRESVVARGRVVAFVEAE